MSRLNDIEKLRGWCHKILPLVYDDSLSYYEVLCKVRAKINEVIDLTAEQNDVIEEAVQEITDWETETDGKYDEFTRQINQDFDDFKSAVNDDIADYKGDMVDLYNQFLEDYLQDLGVVQVEGQQTDKVMSQKATTDALAGKVSTSAVKQVTGSSTTDVISQKGITDALATKVSNSEVKQSTGQSVSDIMSQKATTDALAGKIDTSAVKQATGSSTSYVMSQNAITAELNKGLEYAENAFQSTYDIQSELAWEIGAMDAEGKIAYNNTVYYHTPILNCKIEDVYNLITYMWSYNSFIGVYHDDEYVGFYVPRSRKWYTPAGVETTAITYEKIRILPYHLEDTNFRKLNVIDKNKNTVVEYPIVLTANKYVDKNTGEISPIPGVAYYASNKIRISTKNLIVRAHTYGDDGGYAFYDEDGVYISGDNISQSSTYSYTSEIEIPVGAVYFAFSCIYPDGSEFLKGVLSADIVSNELNSYNDTKKEVEQIKTDISKAEDSLTEALIWTNGAWSMTTGEFDDSVETYYSTQWFSRYLENVLKGFPYDSGYSYLVLKYKGEFKGTYYNNKYHDTDRTEVSEYDWDEFAICVYGLEIPNYQTRIYIDNLPKLADKIDNIQFEKHTAVTVTTAQGLIGAINNIATSIANNIASKYNQYDIHLANGTYELYPYLDLSRATSADSPFARGLEIPDYVNLIGDGDVTISCTIPEEDNSAEHPYSYIISTLNIYANNRFENIKIVGSNTKYCVHDDYGGTINDCKVEFINCTFEHTGMESSTYWASPWCYGAGYDTNHIGIFKNCIFKHIEYGCLYVHTSGYGSMSSPCHIYVDDCAFDTPTGECIGFQVPWSTTNSVSGTLTVNNCYFADEKTIKLWGVLPSTLFGGGNTAGITITNENSSVIYMNN